MVKQARLEDDRQDLTRSGEVIQALNDTNTTPITAEQANTAAASVDQYYQTRYDKSAAEIEVPDQEAQKSEDNGEGGGDSELGALDDGDGFGASEIEEETDDNADGDTDESDETNDSDNSDGGSGGDDQQDQGNSDDAPALRFTIPRLEYGDGTNTHADKVIAPGFGDAADVAIFDTEIGPSEPSDEIGSQEYDKKREKSIANGGAGVSPNSGDGGGDDMGGMDDMGDFGDMGDMDDFANADGDDFGDFNMDMGEDNNGNSNDNGSEMHVNLERKLFQLAPATPEGNNSTIVGLPKLTSQTVDIFTPNTVTLHLNPPGADGKVHVTASFAGSTYLPPAYYRAKFNYTPSPKKMRNTLMKVGELAAARVGQYAAKPISIRVQTDADSLAALTHVEFSDTSAARTAIIEMFTGDRDVNDIANTLFEQLEHSNTATVDVSSYFCAKVAQENTPGRALSDKQLAEIYQHRNVLGTLAQRLPELNRYLEGYQCTMVLTNDQVSLIAFPSTDAQTLGITRPHSAVQLGTYLVSRDHTTRISHTKEILDRAQRRYQSYTVAPNHKFALEHVKQIKGNSVAGLENYTTNPRREYQRNDCIIHLQPHKDKLNLVACVSGQYYAERKTPAIVYARQVAMPKDVRTLDTTIKHVAMAAIKQLALVTSHATNVRLLVPQVQYADLVGRYSSSKDLMAAQGTFISACEGYTPDRKLIQQLITTPRRGNTIYYELSQYPEFAKLLMQHQISLNLTLGDYGYQLFASTDSAALCPLTTYDRMDNGYRILANITIDGTANNMRTARERFRQYLPTALPNEYFGVVAGQESFYNALVYLINTATQCLVGAYRIGNTLWKKSRNAIMNNNMSLRKILKFWKIKLEGSLDYVREISLEHYKTTALPRDALVATMEAISHVFDLAYDPKNDVFSSEGEVVIGDIAKCKHEFNELGIEIALGGTKHNITKFLDKRRHGSLKSLGYTPSNVEALVDLLDDLNHKTEKKFVDTTQMNYDACATKLNAERNDLKKSKKGNSKEAEAVKVKSERLAAVGALSYSAQHVLKLIIKDTLNVFATMEDAIDDPKTKIKDIEILQTEKNTLLSDLLNE